MATRITPRLPPELILEMTALSRRTTNAVLAGLPRTELRLHTLIGQAIFDAVRAGYSAGLRAAEPWTDDDEVTK